jgi:hypothetical protein
VAGRKIFRVSEISTMLHGTVHAMRTLTPLDFLYVRSRGRVQLANTWVSGR